MAEIGPRHPPKLTSTVRWGNQRSGDIQRTD
jgi:hypothetical protein